MVGYEERSFIGTKRPALVRIRTMIFGNADRYAASLDVRKLYPVLSDPDAESNDLIRVIDESGEDYLYPTRLFQRVTLPAELQRALRLAS